MHPRLRRVILFGLGFVPLFVFFLWLYPRILPGYERVVLAVANPFLGHLSTPLRVVVGPDGDLDAFAALSPGASRRLFDKSYAPHVIFMNLVFLPALMLATPLGVKARMRGFLFGLLILFPLHVGTVIVLLQSLLSLQQTPQDFSWFWIHGVALTSGQVMGVAVWALLSWGFWFPRIPDGVIVPGAARIGRNDPCPCGVGRKFKHCCGRRAA